MTDAGPRRRGPARRRALMLLLALVALAACGLVAYHHGLIGPADGAPQTATTADVRPTNYPPAIRPEKRNYKFQAHQQGPYPFSYSPPVEPHELVQMLHGEIELGVYSLDRETALTAAERTPAENAPALNDQRWHVKKRSYPHLLAALAAELPPALDASEPPRGVFGAARMVAVTVDARAAAGFAEVGLRLASPKHVPRALDHLAGAYWLAREFDRLDALLAAGPDYRPTAANALGLPAEAMRIIERAAPAPDNPELLLQLALVLGDVDEAANALAAVNDHKLQQACAPLVARLQHGLHAGLTPKRAAKQKAAVTARFTDLRRQLDGVRRPVHERFADWPIDRLEDHLRWAANALGGYSDPVADLLAYMVEQRQYVQARAQSGTALCAGKRLATRGEPARALPMFLLCQKLGYLSADGQFEKDGPDAMVAFNAFEAPIYFARTILGHHGPGHLRRLATEHNDLYRVTMQMYDYSLAHCRDHKSAGIAGRHGYEAIAMRHRWDLAVQTDRGQDVLDEMKLAMREAGTREIRSYAALRLADFYYRTESHRKAAQVFADLAAGRVHGRCSTYSLHKLKMAADETGDPAIAELLCTTAQEMLEQYKDELAAQASLDRVERLAAYTPNTPPKRMDQ